MRLFNYFWTLMLAIVFSTSVYAEDWKGTPEAPQYGVGVLGGMGVLNGAIGPSVMATVSRVILKKGFAPDINDSVSLEAMGGPIFFSDTTAFAYSVHLRWDFIKDSEWTFYGLGGFGGDIYSVPLQGVAGIQQGSTNSQFYPRFGVGAFWKMNDLVHWRADISHEQLAIGVMFAL